MSHRKNELNVTSVGYVTTLRKLRLCGVYFMFFLTVHHSTDFFQITNLTFTGRKLHLL
jgi:hypothetical protein